MRFFVSFSLSNSNNHVSFTKPTWLKSVNPASTTIETSGVRGSLHYYKQDKPGIVEMTWQNPLYEDDQHCVVVMGSPYYRVAYMERKGSYVPDIKDLFRIYSAGVDSFFTKVKGDFYFFVYNKKSRNLDVLCSPFNVYPAWYKVYKGSVYFSNCLESLIMLGDGWAYDTRGLLEFSMFDHCLGNRTIYRDIKLLEGGKILTWKNNTVGQRVIYDISKWYHDKPKSKSASLDELDYCLKRHINEYTQSIANFNCALTGGYDSRLNFSYIADSDYGRMQTYSYGKPGSLQIKVPYKVAGKLGHSHQGIILGDQFTQKYSKYATDAITMSDGVSPFVRAMYPYAFGILSRFSKHSIIGQCDMIRPLAVSQPAGAIYNDFSKSVFFDSRSAFIKLAEDLVDNNYLRTQDFRRVEIEEIYESIERDHITPYRHLDRKTQFWFFLHKESMLKFWHTECHLTENFVDYFIPFKDLDFIEALTNSDYSGLYKGILEKSNLKRLGAHDLYVDLMTRNKNSLNNIETDRMYKPKWYKYLPAGYTMMWFAKQRQKRFLKLGNDTFEGQLWHDRFINRYKSQLYGKSSIVDLGKQPYQTEQVYRRNRFISIQIWHSYLQGELSE